MPKPENFYKINDFEFNDNNAQYRLEVCLDDSQSVWIFPKHDTEYAFYIKIDWDSEFPSWTLKRARIGDGMNFSLVKSAEYFGIQHYKTQYDFVNFVKRICEVYNPFFNSNK